MSSFDFEGHITDIVDYPKSGVVFKDITTLLKDPDGFEATIDAIAEHFKDAGVTKVVGAEARGFMTARRWRIACMPVSCPLASRASCRARFAAKAMTWSTEATSCRSTPMPSNPTTWC